MLEALLTGRLLTLVELADEDGELEVMDTLVLTKLDDVPELEVSGFGGSSSLAHPTVKIRGKNNHTMWEMYLIFCVILATPSQNQVRLGSRNYANDAFRVLSKRIYHPSKKTTTGRLTRPASVHKNTFNWR